MDSTSDRARPPYRQIADAIRDRIAVGELLPGDAVPSTRQLTAEYGVAMATATKVLAALRQDGLIETRPGVGARVTSRPAPQRPATPRGTEQLSRERIVHAAMRIADREGLDALTIRRVATDLDVGTMSLYRHVASKDELLTQLSDAAFEQRPLPHPGPTGWRERLELISSIQWNLYLDHPWLAQTISFTRPLLAPNAMAHTEWTLATLDGLGLSPATVAREAITLPAIIRSIALTHHAELHAERETGLTKQAWWARNAETAEWIERTGPFPMLERMASDDVIGDFRGMYEHALRLHLDGLAALIERGDPPT